MLNKGLQFEPKTTGMILNSKKTFLYHILLAAFAIYTRESFDYFAPPIYVTFPQTIDFSQI